ALYLDRYWREERRLAADLRAFADASEPAAPASAAAPLPPDTPTRRPPPADTLPPDTPPPDALDPQAHAVEVALRRRFTVIAGGPGTGKTTTVARIVARL